MEFWPNFFGQNFLGEETKVQFFLQPKNFGFKFLNFKYVWPKNFGSIFFQSLQPKKFGSVFFKVFGQKSLGL